MIYDFNVNTNATELLPPSKRKPSNIRFIWSLLSPFQWIRDLIFGSYYEGSTAPAYSAGTYNYMDQVIYNRKVYMSLFDDNTDAPTSNKWLLIQDNFIGVKERILYSSGKLIFEYLLNKEYGTTFRQPTEQSDIYITNHSSENFGFFVGTLGSNSSTVGQTTSADNQSRAVAVGSSFTKVYLTHFQINIPSSLNSQIDHIRDYANQFNTASLKFTIVTY